MRSLTTHALVSAIVALAIVAKGAAAEIEQTGYFATQVREFWQDARFEAQSQSYEHSFVAHPEIYWRNASGDKRARFVAFARGDSHDDRRTHTDIREAHFSIDRELWDLTIGVNKVFWGVAESRHLVDVINQTDLVDDIDQEQKLGQPMLNANFNTDLGRFELFILPYFRERTFPGKDGRLRTPLAVDASASDYEASAEQRHVDFAVRYSQFIGNLDIGISAFDGTSREPMLTLSPSGDRLRPFYEQMSQAGIDLQYTADAWLWKLEALARNAQSDTFLAAVAGFEYTRYDVAETGLDVGLLFEALYDGRDDNAPRTVFDNDLFVGARVAFNNAADTTMLAGITIDTKSNETFLNVEAERRFGQTLVAELRLRAFGNAGPNDASFAVARDDYVQLGVRWYY